MEVMLNMMTQMNRTPNALPAEVSGKLNGQKFKDLMSQHLVNGNQEKSLTKAIDSLDQAIKSLYQSLVSGDLAEIEPLSKELTDSLQKLDQLLGEGFEKQLLTLVQGQTMMDDNQALELMGMALFNKLNQQSSSSPEGTLIQSGNRNEVKILAKILQLSDSLPQNQTLQQNSKLNLPKDLVTKWVNFVKQINGNDGQKQMGQQVSSQLVKAVKNLIVQPTSFHEYKLQLPRQPIQHLDNGKVMMTDQPVVSKQEQLVIHLSRQSQTSSQPQQQLIDQLQKMIQQTRFSQLGGQKQLSIQLKPANLGDMTLKFTQIDGQMTVKITVSTLAAKEMIEGNMQQLRHMFSPNQVVVERQAESLSSDDQQLFGQEDQSSDQKHSDDEQREQSDTNDEQSGKSFKELLFEEEV